MDDLKLKDLEEQSKQLTNNELLYFYSQEIKNEKPLERTESTKVLQKEILSRMEK